MKILSQTSAMPCRSFSLPARKTCPGSAVAIRNARAAGYVGICEECYADNGFYRMPNVKESGGNRLAWRNESLANGTFARDLAREISETVLRTGNAYFRFHDSGDVDSPEYARALLEVCRSLPGVRFWLPTRSYHIPAILAVLREIAALPNVAVRPSADGFEQPAPDVPGLHAGTASSRHVWDCAKPAQGNQCLDCRRCFDNKDESIVYKAH